MTGAGMTIGQRRQCSGWRRALTPLTIVATLCFCPAYAQETPSPLDLRADWTQFLGSAIAGDGKSEPRYGGRLDGYARIDGAAAGLWDGLTINVQAEYVYGDSTNRIGAQTLLPVNAALSIPVSNDEAFDLSVNIVQKLGKLRLQAGKINLFDASVNLPVVAGGGKEGFQHMALAAPPGLIASPKVLGAIASGPVGPFTFSLGIWTPESWVRRYVPKGAFEHGVNAMFVATLPARVGGRQGYHSATIYLTSRRVNGREEYPDIQPPPGSGLLLPRDPGGLHVRYALQQYLWQDPLDPKRGWGLFGHIGFSTGAPGILDWSGTFGIAGSPPIRSRPNDRFGIGYFRFSLAERVVDGMAPVLQLHDEQGAEIYYTAELARNFRLTANAQLIDPVIENAATAAYMGLRLKTSF